MSSAWERRESAINRAIRKSAEAAAQPARGRWELVLSNGHPFGVSAILDDAWLLLESPLTRGPALPSPAELLRSNGSLPGLAKFADPARGRAASIQAEVPIGEGIDIAARIRETLRGFSGAHAIVSGKPIPLLADRVPPESDPALAQDIASTVRKIDWPFRERDDGSIAVDLGSDGGYHQARLAALPGRRFAASVEVADWRGGAPSCRRAAAQLLLAANNGMRMARAVAAEDNEHWSGRFEICLGSAPTEAECRHVLAALSVACRHWARELRALQKESTARAYLAVRAVGS